MNIPEIIDATIARICHDLIGPLGTAQMAIESGETQILHSCIEQAIEKLDLIRNTLRMNMKTENSMALLEKYIDNHQLNFKIREPWPIPSLIFFLAQKFSSKTTGVFVENEILLESFFLSEDEQNALMGKATNISAGNILPYLAYLRYHEEYALKIQNPQEKTWKISIKKI